MRELISTLKKRERERRGRGRHAGIDSSKNLFAKSLHARKKPPPPPAHEYNCVSSEQILIGEVSLNYIGLRNPYWGSKSVYFISKMC